MITQDRINELREVAKAATPGPWDARCREFSNTELPRNIWTEYGYIAKTENCDQVQNATHIATFNPTQVLELLDHIEVYQKVLKTVANMGDPFIREIAKEALK